MVQLPGIKDPQRPINLIGKTALLQLKAVDDSVNPEEVAQGKVTLSPDLQLLSLREVDDNRQVTGKRPIVVRRQAVITGANLTSAEVRPDDQGGWLVAFSLDSEGAQVFGDFTGANVGKYLAIVMDGVIVSCARIESAITEGSGRITGDFQLAEARSIVVQLRYGALPVPLKRQRHDRYHRRLGGYRHDLS